MPAHSITTCPRSRLLIFIRLALTPFPRYARLVGKPFDILVRPGTARQHRVNALLDRLKESGAGPVQLRVLIQARLPRGNARPVQLEYQRITSVMVDCRTPEAAQHARRAIRSAIQALNRARISEPERPRKVDIQTVPGEILLDELDRRGLAMVDFDSVPDAILRREFGRRLRGKRRQPPATEDAARRSAPPGAS